MPAHRNPSRSQSHAPYKPPIIVISSDEEDNPRPKPPRGLRKPRRSKPQEVLEILDDTPVKHEEETETEKLRLLCHELEQVGSPCTVWIPIKSNTFTFRTPRNATCCKVRIDAYQLPSTS